MSDPKNKPKKNKTFKEDFAKFFENPTRENFRDLLRSHVGEISSCDFKAEWPKLSSIAKHVLGMANSGGGCIIIGVKEDSGTNSLSCTGLPTLMDKADVVNSLNKYIPNNLVHNYDLLDFSYTESEYKTLVGKSFQVLIVDPDEDYVPYVSTSDGDGIHHSRVYVRRSAMTVEASNEELHRLINKRIESGYSTTKELDLKNHLEQIKLLMSELTFDRTDLGVAVGGLMGLFSGRISQRTRTDYEDFLRDLVEKKKDVIRREIGC